MKNRAGFLGGMFLLAMFCLAGCTQATNNGSASPSATRTAAPSRTQTPSPTITPTATGIPTVLPMASPSPGPAPDLEIFNVSIVNETYNYFYFMAEMRNNSDDPLIFNEREIGMRLTFEQWWEWTDLHHSVLEAPIRPMSGRMNCILFPGETGVIAFFTRAECPNEKTCPRTDEEIEGPLEKTGTQLIGYQADFRRWKDLKQQYPFDRPGYGYPEQLENYNHPEAENIDFSVDGARFLIEYDVELVFPPYGTYSGLSWIILYDSSDRIINVLFTRPIYCEGVGCFISGTYHLFGVGSNAHVPRDPTAAPGQFTDWWRPVMELTAEQLQRVDHIRLLSELQNWSMCMKPLE